MHQSVVDLGSLPPQNNNPDTLSNKGVSLPIMEQVPKPSFIPKPTLNIELSALPVSPDPLPQNFRSVFPSYHSIFCLAFP